MTITMLSGKQSNMRLQLGGQALEEHDHGGAHARASPAAEALGRWRSGRRCFTRVPPQMRPNEQAKAKQNSELAACKDTSNPGC